MDKQCEGKKKCLKEINPEVYPGKFFGEPFKYDETWHACFLCDLGPDPEPDEPEDDFPPVAI